MEAKIDLNRVKSALAITDDASQTTRNILVDPTTDRVLIELNPLVQGATTLHYPNAQRDENHVPTMLALKDDGSNTLMEVAIDNRNGYILVDLIEE